MPPCVCNVETFHCLLKTVLCSSTGYIISKEQKACVLSVTLQKCVTTYWFQYNTMFQACCIHCPCINWYRCNIFEFGAADSLTASFPGWSELGAMLLGFGGENTRIQLYWYTVHNKNRNLPKQRQKSNSRNKSNMELSAVWKWHGGFYTGKPHDLSLFCFLLSFCVTKLCCYWNENLSDGVHISTNISMKANAYQHPDFSLLSIKANIACLLAVSSRKEHKWQKTQMSSNTHY